MGTGELHDAGARGKPAGSPDPLHGVGRLGHLGGRLGAQGFLRESWVLYQLRQAAGRAEPHRSG